MPDLDRVGFLGIWVVPPFGLHFSLRQCGGAFSTPDSKLSGDPGFRRGFFVGLSPHA
jgi:hypothetical protein